MKKMNLLLLLLFTTFYLISGCSNEDNNLRSNYRVALGIDCDTPDPRTYYCVTQAEYERTDNLTGPCEIVTITDIYGETHQGVPNGWSFSIDGYDCN